MYCFSEVCSRVFSFSVNLQVICLFSPFKSTTNGAKLKDEEFFLLEEVSFGLLGDF